MRRSDDVLLDSPRTPDQNGRAKGYAARFQGMKEFTMRLALCHYSLHRRWKEEKWSPVRLAEEVKALGIEAVDFHAGMMAPAESAVERIREALKATGLALSGLSLSNDFNREKAEEFRAEVATVRTWIAVAAELKAPVSRIFGGHLPNAARTDAADKAAGQQRILDALAEVVRDAERRGLVLALENHGGLPCTGEEQVEVLRAINSKSLRATIDVGNYLQGNQEGHVGTAVAAPYAAYVHFKDFKKRPDPAAAFGYKLEPCVVGEGDVNHRACLDALRSAGYRGFIALEYEGIEAEQTGVPRSAAFMKKLAASR